MLLYIHYRQKIVHMNEIILYIQHYEFLYNFKDFKHKQMYFVFHENFTVVFALQIFGV